MQSEYLKMIGLQFMVNKLTTYRTLAGTQRTIPVVSAEYVKIK